jgi:hypothetical protein
MQGCENLRIRGQIIQQLIVGFFKEKKKQKQKQSPEKRNLSRGLLPNPY